MLGKSKPKRNVLYGKKMPLGKPSSKLFLHSSILLSSRKLLQMMFEKYPTALGRKIIKTLLKKIEEKVTATAPSLCQIQNVNRSRYR